MSEPLDLPATDTAGDAAALWLSLSDIARLKGVERATIWEKAQRLVNDGLLTMRPGKGKRKLVNLAEYDRLVGETTDFARQQAAVTRSREDDADPSFTTAQTRKMQYDADMKQMDLAQRRGELVRTSELDEAAREVCDTITRVIDGIVRRAEEVTMAVTKDSLAGARGILKKIAFDLRTAIADACESLKMKGRAVQADKSHAVDLFDEDDPE
jgi:biotin operon repressor